MPRRNAVLVLPALLVLVSAARYAGGWAVITVDDLPDQVTAGRPVTLSFTVRQHGLQLLDGLRPRLSARRGAIETSVDALGKGGGRYQATITPSTAGDWTFAIRSGFGNSNTTLLPMPAVDAGSSTPILRLAERERGRRLFVAKGCLSCHVHGEVAGSGTVTVGPELTGKRYAADYLAKYLADPSIVPPRAGMTWRMPNLNLKQAEVASLVAFVNGDRAVTLSSPR
jgi:mono/diheme cytochrome c family protein